MKFEFWLWILIWTVETLIIKYGFGVESWIISVILAVTVGSFAVWMVRHLPEVLD